MNSWRSKILRKQMVKTNTNFTNFFEIVVAYLFNLQYNLDTNKILYTNQNIERQE